MDPVMKGRAEGDVEMDAVGTHMMTGCLRRMLFALAASLFSAGCAAPLTIPIATVWYEQPAAAAHALLIVYLPGNGDKSEAFERHGLLESLRNSGVPADVVGVNAVLGYYTNGSIFQRLEDDVIKPAKTKGYERIWLVGNSLGGYGALAYLGGHKNEIAGVVLLGPFVGDREPIEAIMKMGGLRNWDPGQIDPTDWKKKLLLLLKDYDQHRDAYPPVYLGFGSFDKFAVSQRFLAEVLPKDRVIELSGGHEWWTWSKAWKQFMEKGIMK